MKPTRFERPSPRRLAAARLAVAALALAGIGPIYAAVSVGSPPRPNILFILADDLGYGDLGVLYQNHRSPGEPRMATPQLDRLAAEGMIFRQHYTAAPVCAPARASLLLGQHQGHCAVRDNQFDKALPRNHTLASVLHQAGYHTGIIGKYGLAGPRPELPAHPLRRGFDEFYGVLGHGEAHHHYPGNTGLIMDQFTPVTNGLECAYDTDLYAARAKKFIRERATSESRQPFFLYLAFTAPHFYEELPTQPYPAGRGTNGGLQWPLNTNSGPTNSWYHPEYASQNWPDVEKRHATMVRRVDDAVGDLLQLLRDLGLATNTLVVFTSDNGPHNEQGQDPSFFGSWANLDGIKRDLWEAGIREPTLAWWPGHVRPGSTSDEPSWFPDWLPTFADLAGLTPPAESDGVSLVPTLTGEGTQRHRGFLYWEYQFGGKPGRQFPVDAQLFPRKEVNTRGQLQALRLGNFVGVRYTVTNSAVPFRVYNVVTDPHEDHDLAGYSTNAALLARIKATVREVRRPEPSARRPYDRDLLPSVTPAAVEPGHLECAWFEGDWPWVPDFATLRPGGQSDSAAGLQLGTPAATNSFGLAFTGFFSAPTNGLYTFYLTCDTGAQMWLHEAHVLDDDFNHTGAEVAAEIRLQAGRHPFRLFYRHRPGPCRLELKYSGPGLEKQTVPISAFSCAR